MATPQAPPSNKPRKSTSQSLITADTLSDWARAGRTHRYPCGDGLYFQTKPTTASWVFRFRFGGVRRAMGLGAFPEVDLAVAREKADRARLALREGRDPFAEREAAPTQAQAPKHLAKWLKRKWPSRLFPAEVTSQIGELCQENSALRRKVALLEQKLAQQRPMAKTARQEGLAMTALKAAMTKPNGGAVSYYDANGECHETDSPPQYPLSKPRWFPQEAWPKVEEMWEGNLSDKEERMALKRLATNGKMRPVWEKLHNVKGTEEIIPEAIDARRMSAPLRPPPQSKRREARQRYQQHLDKLWMIHPHPTRGYDWGACASLACDLRNILARLRELDPTVDEQLSQHLRRGPLYKDDRFQPFLDEADYTRCPPTSTTRTAIGLLHALFHCFLSIDDEYQSNRRMLPWIVHWDDLAPRRFFAQIMSNKMQELCGRPRHDVVAVLVRVAFDLDDDVTTETVRGWCRWCSRQELQN